MSDKQTVECDCRLGGHGYGREHEWDCAVNGHGLPAGGLREAAVGVLQAWGARDLTTPLLAKAMNDLRAALAGGGEKTDGR